MKEIISAIVYLMLHGDIQINESTISRIKEDAYYTSLSKFPEEDCWCLTKAIEYYSKDEKSGEEDPWTAWFKDSGWIINVNHVNDYPYSTSIIDAINEFDGDCKSIYRELTEHDEFISFTLDSKLITEPEPNPTSHGWDEEELEFNQWIEDRSQFYNNGFYDYSHKNHLHCNEISSVKKFINSKYLTGCAYKGFVMRIFIDKSTSLHKFIVHTLTKTKRCTNNQFELQINEFNIDELLCFIYRNKITISIDMEDKLLNEISKIYSRDAQEEMRSTFSKIGQYHNAYAMFVGQDGMR